jgi:hypothetical protein
VRYASKFQDGSIAAIVSLGRNYATGIKWAQVLRALCDVSLTKSSSVGKKKEVCMVDLAASPDAKNAASYMSGASQSSDDARKAQPNDEIAGATAFLSKHAVYVDGDMVNKPLGGEMVLRNGAIIYLYGHVGFAYQVVISQNDKDAPATCKSTTPKNRKANPPMEESPIEEKQPSAHDKIRQ